MQNNVQTIAITNFGGRLTRILNGDLNSGFAKFHSSFGYDPFTKPMNLTWLPQPTSIAGVQGVIMDGVNKENGGGVNLNADTFMVGTGGLISIGDHALVYQLRASVPSIIAISSVATSLSFGASMQFFGQNERLYIAGDDSLVVTGSVTGVRTFTLNGQTSTVAAANYRTNIYHPLEEFAGKLIFGNGPSIGAVDATGTVVSSIFTISAPDGNQYSQLNPPLPANQFVRDLDVSQDGNYLYISGSTVAPELLVVSSTLSSLFFLSSDKTGANIGKGAVYGWNGVDQGITTSLSIPGGAVTALQVYLNAYRAFFSDTFGASLSDGQQKLVTLTKNKVPLPNSVGVNGNFLTWATPETLEDGSRVAALYYYGALDEQGPSGLYRLLRWETNLPNGVVYQVPYQALVLNSYKPINSSITGLIGAPSLSTPARHLISTYSVSSVISMPSVATAALLAFDVYSETPPSNVTPQEGVYETQTQLFSKKVQIAQIRVYTEPTVTGNGFQIDLIGSDGDVIENGTYTYSFAAGDDITRLQGSLQRINFNPDISPGYAFGVRVTNTGTTNMTIKKIEIDYTQEGK